MENEDGMTLNTGDWFNLNLSDEKNLFHQVNIFVRNNGSNIVTVTSDEKSILISVEKPVEEVSD